VKRVVVAVTLAVSLGASPAAATDSPGPEAPQTAGKTVDLIGHRGARGLRPENTLPAFAEALSIGVSAIELDAGVSRDGVVVVTHDQVLNPDLARTADGKWLEAAGRPVTRYTLAELKTFDVGRLNPSRDYAGNFLKQRPVDGTAMPTLKQVIDLVRRAGNDDVRLDVEIKGNPEKPEMTLGPAAYAEKVVQVVRDEGFADRASILSFDWRTLRRVREIAPDIPTVCLTIQRRFDNIRKGRPGPSPWTAGLDIDDVDGSVPRLVQAAGCGVWSVYYKDLDSPQLAESHALGLKVLVWTVNEPSDMRDFIDIGVDGIVTDYPDVLRAVLIEKAVPVAAPTPVKP
jgi:glycerophosphoryl diester phosphodiesterase